MGNNGRITDIEDRICDLEELTSQQVKLLVKQHSDLSIVTAVVKEILADMKGKGSRIEKKVLGEHSKQQEKMMQEVKLEVETERDNKAAAEIIK